MIIAISGKTGVGKTTFARFLAPKVNAEILSFATPLKDEVAQVFGINRQSLDTQEGKASSIRLNRKQQYLLGVAAPSRDWTVREILQAYGQYRRTMMPEYWSNAMACKIRDANLIIDDMRYLDELRMVESHPLHLLKMLVRIEPYPGWHPGPHSQHISEIDLDDYDAWDIRIKPKFGEIEKHAVQMIDLVSELFNSN